LLAVAVAALEMVNWLALGIADTVAPEGMPEPMMLCPCRNPVVDETLPTVVEPFVTLPVTVKVSLLAHNGSGWVAVPASASAAVERVIELLPTALMVVADWIPAPEMNCPAAKPVVDETATVLLLAVTVPVNVVTAGRGVTNSGTLVALTFAFCDKVSCAVEGETAAITVAAGIPAPAIGWPTANPAVEDRLDTVAAVVGFCATVPVTDGGEKLPLAANRVWAHSLALASAPGFDTDTAAGSDRVSVPPETLLMVVAGVVAQS